MKKVVVTIKSKITDSLGNIEKTDLSSDGSYAIKNGSYYIVYKENDVFGNLLNTTIKVESDNKVMLSRNGSNATRLYIEKGERNLCYYSTGFGSFVVGVYTTKVQVSLNEDGGYLRFCYNLDVNSDKLSKNEIEVIVKEA